MRDFKRGAIVAKSSNRAIATTEDAVPELLTSPVYRKAPIMEAVIDFRVSSQIKEKSQSKFVGKLNKDYPRSNALQKIAFQLDTTGGTVQVDQEHTGHQLATDDLLEVVVVQSNGITISQRAPYRGWRRLEERTKSHWATWRETIGHSQIVRIGVRFINRIDVPIAVNSQVSGAPPGVSVNEYLNFFVNDPIVNNNPMESYLVQTVRTAKLPHWKHSITSTVVNPPPLINHMSLLLDIDVFRIDEIPGHPSKLWEIMAEARMIKNDIFERCITKATRGLIA